MARIRLQRVEQPDPGAWVFDETNNEHPSPPEGVGDIDYVCAGCDAVLYKNFSVKALGPGLVMKCAHCGTFNKVAGT